MEVHVVGQLIQFLVKQRYITTVLFIISIYLVVRQDNSLFHFSVHLLSPLQVNYTLRNLIEHICSAIFMKFGLKLIRDEVLRASVLKNIKLKNRYENHEK